MKKRMTLTFKSKKGNEYLYDDSTGLILPWSKEDEKILKQLLEGNKTEDILKDGDVHESKVHYLSYLLDQTGAFLEECDIRVKYPGEEEIVDFIGSNLARQLILSVTDDCNLRCKYCIYSDAYHLTKDKSCKYMTEETAKRAIDYFFELISPQLRRNPRKKIGITFYGGEPLMNMKTIKYAVRYIKQFYKENVYYMLTTNGLLLNDANIKFLSENEIGLAISIDGPQKEHDRLRVKIDGSGSFEQIASNIKKLSEAYPYYFRTRVNAVCVFDPKTDIEKVEEFYEELEKTYNIPRAIFVNKVSDNETNYYDQFSDTDNQKYDDRIKNLMRKFHEKKVADKEISSYLSAIAGGGPMSVIVRRRIDEIQGHCIKSSGACIPGQKICVNSSGIFDICERVNGHNSIGNVEQGIDGKAVLKIMKEYNEVALEDCSNCPIKKLCGYCYLNFETENGFKKNKAGCAFHRNVVKTNLSRYVSIYEENPNCRYFLDTDTAELENN